MRRFLFVPLVFAMIALAHAQESEDAPDKDVAPRLVVETGGHTMRVAQLFYTEDGSQIVSVGRDHTIRFWDAESGELLRTVRTHANLLENAPSMMQTTAVSADRKVLVLSDQPSKARRKEEKTRIFGFVNLATGKMDKLEVEQLGGFTNALALSPDGNHLAVGGEAGMQLWNTKTRKLEREIKKDGKDSWGGQSLAFTSDGKRLAALVGKDVHVVNMETKREHVAIELSGVKGDYHSLLWAANNRDLFICHGKGIELWDTMGEKKDKKKDSYAIGRTNVLAWDRDRKLLVTGGVTANGKEARVSLFDPALGKVIHQYQVPHDKLEQAVAVAISPDGKRVAAAAPDRVIHVWDLATEKRRLTLGGQTSFFQGVGWSKDGTKIAWGRTFNPFGGDKLADQRPLEQAFNLDAMEMVGGKPTGYVRADHNLKGAAIQVGEFPKLLTKGKVISLMKVPPGDSTCGTFVGNQVILGGSDGMLHFFNAQTGAKTHSTRGHPAEVTDMAPSQDGRYLLTASRDQTLKVWRIDTPRKENLLLTLSVVGRDWIAWTPEGYYAATPGGERLMGWTVHNRFGEISTFLPADRFRDVLHRPDIVKLVREKAGSTEAVKVANAALPEKERPKSDAPAKVEELLPPVVTLQKAGEPNDKNEVTFKVSAKAGVKTQPITSLRLFVDGRPFSDSPPVNFEKGVADYQKPWPVTLPPGKHTVAMLARSADASSLSNEIEVDCRPAKDKPVMHVLAIGIDKYQTDNLNLSCAVADAKLIANTFQQQCKGPLFADVKTHLLTNTDATAKAVREAITGLRTDPKNKVKAGDLVVVFFAGHGAKEKDKFYLLTHEAVVGNLAGTALSGATLRDELKEFPCQVLLIMDACQSGAFGEKGALAGAGLRPATDDATRSFTADEVGVTVFCAAMGYEKAAEGMGNGLFTKWLAKALTEKSGVPYRQDNLQQYINHIETYVQDKVAKESDNKQHPFLHRPWTVEPFPLRQLPAKLSGSK